MAHHTKKDDRIRVLHQACSLLVPVPSALYAKLTAYKWMGLNTALFTGKTVTNARHLLRRKPLKVINNGRLKISFRKKSVTKQALSVGPYSLLTDMPARERNKATKFPPRALFPLWARTPLAGCTTTLISPVMVQSARHCNVCE